MKPLVKHMAHSRFSVHSVVIIVILVLVEILPSTVTISLCPKCCCVH